jgi:hypothetical protein
MTGFTVPSIVFTGRYLSCFILVPARFFKIQAARIIIPDL